MNYISFLCMTSRMSLMMSNSRLVIVIAVHMTPFMGWKVERLLTLLQDGVKSAAEGKVASLTVS